MGAFLLLATRATTVSVSSSSNHCLYTLGFTEKLIYSDESAYPTSIFVAMPQGNSISATRIEPEQEIIGFLGIVLVAESGKIYGRATETTGHMVM